MNLNWNWNSVELVTIINLNVLYIWASTWGCGCLSLLSPVHLISLALWTSPLNIREVDVQCLFGHKKTQTILTRLQR